MQEPASGSQIGLRILELSDPNRARWRGDGPRPVRAYVWYPTAGAAAPFEWSPHFVPATVAFDAPALGERLPVVLLSHGTGGSAWQLGWLAERLVAAGFVAVAVDHHGNNARDPYLPEGFVRVWERPRDLSFVLDRLAESGLVDLTRVGAAGFSLGGYTVAALLGARLDPAAYYALLTAPASTLQLPEYPNLLDDARVGLSDADLWELSQAAAVAVSDERVRAGVLLAPAVGPLLAADSLAAIRRPVLVRWGGSDDIAPPDSNAELYARFIPSADGRSVGAAVGHYAFLAEATDLGRQESPRGCADAPGVARRHVHEQVAAEAVAFFQARLA